MGTVALVERPWPHDGGDNGGADSGDDSGDDSGADSSEDSDRRRCYHQKAEKDQNVSSQTGKS